MKTTRIFALFSATLTLSGCLYVNVTSPLDIDMNETRTGSKVGESASHMILWAVAWGDAGTQAAAKEGGITNILNADRRTQSYVLGIYTKETTIVYGD